MKRYSALVGLFVLVLGLVGMLATETVSAQAYPPPATGKTVLLKPRKHWQEPNSAEYVNYCGPGATLVALDVAGLELSMIPDIDTIALRQNIDPSRGVFLTNVADSLNFYMEQAGQSFRYEYRPGRDRAPVTKSELGAMIRQDIDSGHALLTGVKTGAMNGWNGHDVYHIVAVIGYKTGSHGQVSRVAYAETAAPMAGYNGKYIQWVSFNTFWSYVQPYNEQAW